jgi:hypothetical protein
MKKTALGILILTLLFAFSCKKNSSDNTTTVTIMEDSDSSNSVSKGQIYYVKYNQIWSVKNEEDLGKSYDTVERNSKKLLDFGNDGTVIKSKTVEGKDYLLLKIPDDEVWVEKRYVTERFFLIKDTDVKVYKSPGDNYLDKEIKLQQGDLGFFIKEDNGFYNIQLNRYLPRGRNNEVVWVGEIWIKDGFIDDDFETVREAFQLSRAYEFLYNKKSLNTDSAIKILRQTVEDFQSSPTQISGITANLLMNLTGESTETADTTTTTVSAESGN